VTAEVRPSTLVNVYRRFARIIGVAVMFKTCIGRCLFRILAGKPALMAQFSDVELRLSLLFESEDVAIMFLRNVAKLLPDYTGLTY
jgi:hypothetical protein